LRLESLSQSLRFEYMSESDNSPLEIAGTAGLVPATKLSKGWCRRPRGGFKETQIINCLTKKPSVSTLYK
jgi:hypothetical protein